MLEHHDPLTPAERQTPDSDDTRLGHRRADHPQRLDRDRAVWVEVIRRIKIDGVDVAARHERFQIDHLRALDIERLQLLGGERDELAAIVFISLNDSLSPRPCLGHAGVTQFASAHRLERLLRSLPVARAMVLTSL